MYRSYRAALAAVAALSPLAVWADLPGIIGVPASASAPAFGMQPSGYSRVGRTIPAFHTLVEGQAARTRLRPLTEPLCKQLFELGQIHAMPVYGPGDDEPLSFRSWTYTAPGLGANYREDLTYRAVNPKYEPGRVGSGICDVEYRLQVRRQATLRIQHPDGLEYLEVDYDHHTYRRSLDPRGQLKPVARPGAGELIEGTWPDVYGKDKVLGYPCVVRHQPMGGDKFIEHCIAEDADAVPMPLRMRSLRSYMKMPGVPGDVGLRSELKAWNPALDVDAGLFELPPGFTEERKKGPTRAVGSATGLPRPPATGQPQEGDMP